MADPQDVQTTKLCRKEFVKHRIDVSQCDIRVSHGVVYVRGIIRIEKGAPFSDIQEETMRIARLIRQRPLVRDVVVEVMYR